MTEWIQTDDYQWQRTVDDYYVDDTYEMYEIQGTVDDEPFYLAGGGEFKLSDYTQDEVDGALHDFGYMTMERLDEEYGEASKQILAECLFESDWFSFELKSFHTLEEAQAYVNKLMEV